MSKPRYLWGTVFFLLGLVIFGYREWSVRSADRLRAASRGETENRLPAMDNELYKSLSWNRYALKREGNTVPLRFFLEKTLSCDPGDYEAITESLKQSAEKSLLLSLESISVEDTFEPVTMQINESEFVHGFSRTVDVPATLGPRQLGLFLCKDSEKVGRCAHKPVVGINELLRENLKQGREGRGAEAPDRIYYFQYVYVDADGAFHLFRQSPIDTAELDTFAGRFPKIFSAQKVETERMNLAKVGLFSRTLASAPLTLKTDGFAVTLPGRDKTRCASVADITEKRK